MVLFPTCKINLGLRITAKRKDGYHDLETIFFPVPIKDILEIVPSDKFQFQAYGLPIPGEPAGNLCIRAWQLLKKDFPDLPSVQLHLYKQIPMGAGLGGGSADGAFTLKGLNEQFRLSIDESKLREYAASLGSDCPFFILNKPCYATGRGEMLEPLELDLSGYSLVFVHPGVHVQTAWAFSQLKPAIPARSLKDLIREPIACWKDTIHNDFEKPVTRQYSRLSAIKEKLYAAGAAYASMTGSGSSFFGIFPQDRMPSAASLGSFFGKDFQLVAAK